MSTRSEERLSGKGHMALVGAGPGDPELLTLKALRYLKDADIILHDHLVSDAVLDLAGPAARRIAVGKIGHGAAVSQNEINCLMIALAATGQRVVRLKAGDPLIFGRAGEEIGALEAARVAVDVVPGITAAQAAAASLRLSLTHRNHAQRFQVVTGHARTGTLPSDIDWGAIADPRATTAVYMGRRTVAELVARLMEHGLDADFPAAAVFDASCPKQRTVLGRLADLPNIEGMKEGHAPCVILLGEVVRAVITRQAATSRSA